MPDVASTAERLAAREREIAAVILKKASPTKTEVEACKRYFHDAFTRDPECKRIREMLESGDGQGSD